MTIRYIFNEFTWHFAKAYLYCTLLSFLQYLIMPIQMKKFLVSSMLVFITSIAFGQIVVITPSSAGADEIGTIIFDAAQGNKELMGASKVYMHHGVVTDKANGTAWKYVKGNWGSDDGIGEMTKVEGDANK